MAVAGAIGEAADSGGRETKDLLKRTLTPSKSGTADFAVRGDLQWGVDAAGEMTFIDFEYGAYGDRGFDWGNHFNEWAGYDCDYTQYPTLA